MVAEERDVARRMPRRMDPPPAGHPGHGPVLWKEPEPRSEVDRAPESERGAKVIEVAKMAATKVKKPEICTYWWEKVVQYEPTHEEALSELYKLYERNKEWDKLADICKRQADAAPNAQAKADALQRLGLLYTEKVENSAKAIAA